MADPVTGEHIRPEWVEVGAKALVPNWRRRPLRGPDEARHLDAQTVLVAVVPAIQAQALRDAAEIVRRYNLPDTPVLMYPSAVADALCERADRIESGELT